MKFLMNGSIAAALLSMSSYVDARINVPARDLQTSNLDITVFGTATTITADQVEYDQNQNHEGAGYVEVTGSNAKLVGNMWRSFELPGDGVVVSESTVLSFDIAIVAPFGADFTAICADENAVLGDGKRCWVVAAKEGEFIPDMYNAPNMVNSANPSKTFEIPIGKYFTGTVKHLALLQDNDTGDQSTGESTFSNIAFVEDSPQYFHITVNDIGVDIPDNQLDYDNGQQHTFDHEMQISADDPSSITLVGNTWRAYELPEALYFNESTTVELDVGIDQIAEFHSLCFENDISKLTASRCFTFAGTQGSFGKTMLQKTKVGEVNHYKIPVGHFFTGEVAYLAFGQDKDSDKSKGLTTYSNIDIYDDDRADLMIEVDGNMVKVPHNQVEFHTSRDTKENILEVSADGSSVTMKGDMWRAMALETPIEITKASQLEFDVMLKDQTDVKFLGFGFEDNLSYSSRKIFQLFGSDGGNPIYYPEDAVEGQLQHYSLPVGIDMTSNMTYLVFAQENQNATAFKKTGESTISNIKVYERPDITFKFGEVDTPVFNDQIQYGGNQDSNKRNVWDVSADGLSISVHHNNWKAVKIPPYTINEDTVLMFDFTLTEETEIHAICLDEDLVHDSTKGRCFKVAGSQTSGLGSVITLPDQTEPSDTPVTKSYAFRVGHYIAGVEAMYVSFMQDNDDSDKLGGESTFSNIHLFDAKTCLLDDTSFTLTFDECTFKNTLSGLEGELASKPSCSPNVWSELFGYFTEANHLYDVVEKVGDICASGYDMVSPHSFDHLTGEGYQFVEAFFDGDNKWNYEHDALDDGVNSFDLAKEAGMISVVNGKLANEGMSWPNMHNFEDCDLRAAMCCWVAERKDTTPADVTAAEPTDNSDVCYVDFTRAKRSSHVRDGYSIYNGIAGAATDVEGAVNCHGFAWGDDAGYADSALKGNTLFNVAMQEGLYTNGYVEEVPGAPLCACVEQMPVVTKADCTKINVDKAVSMSYDHTTALFVAAVTINSIAHESCGGGDLSTYYDELVAGGKASDKEKAKLEEIIVGDGNCGAATTTFLSTKGLTLSPQ